MPRPEPSAPIRLDTLDDRLAPSVSVVDLTTRGAQAAAGAAIVKQTDAQPTGTGYINSFVRIQGAASGGGIEQGYNTTARPLQFDENSSPSFTRGITAGAVPRVNINGTDYREFLLDINQKASSPLLSVDEVRLYFGDTPNLTGYDPVAKTLAGKAPAFDLDASPAGDVSVLLNSQLNHGSGSGDMFLYVPDSAFAGTTTSTYVYLYSKMGAQPGASANGGFEEWAVRNTGTITQPPAGVGTLSGYVYGQDLGGNFIGLAGVAIQLNGVDYLGNHVVLTATTDSTGAYTFTGLLPGTYSLLEVNLPDGYQTGQTQVGTIDGTTVGAVSATNADQIVQITLGSGQNGINYDFFEVQPGG